MRLLIIAITILWATEVFAPNVYYTEACFDMMEERIETLRDIRVTKLKIDMYLQAKSTKKRTGFAKIAWDNAVMEITDAIYSASKKYDLDIALIMAIIETESSWRPDVVSHKGARGLMQIMPVWDTVFRENGIIEKAKMIFDIEKNIMAGCFILRHYTVTFPPLGNTLDAYSGGGGETYVAKVRAAKERIETFMNGE